MLKLNHRHVFVSSATRFSRIWASHLFKEPVEKIVQTPFAFAGKTDSCWGVKPFCEPEQARANVIDRIAGLLKHTAPGFRVRRVIQTRPGRLP